MAKKTNSKRVSPTTLQPRRSPFITNSTRSGSNSAKATKDLNSGKKRTKP